MTGLSDILPSKPLALLLRACEDMTLPVGQQPADAIAGIGKTVQAGFAAPGEVLPLVIVLALFLGAIVHVFSRGKASVQEESTQVLTEHVEPVAA